MNIKLYKLLRKFGYSSISMEFICCGEYLVKFLKKGVNDYSIAAHEARRRGYGDAKKLGFIEGRMCLYKMEEANNG